MTVQHLLVTWIAPVIPDLEQLAWLNELGRIQKITNVQVLTRTGADLTRDDVASALREPCDLLIWSGHGAPGGLLLPDHSLIRTKWLASQVSRGCRPRVVILASCGSQQRDENLHSLTEAICRAGINVIGFPTTANDLAAGTFTIEYVRALSVNTAVAVAFDVALEAIADSPTAAGVFLTPGILDLPFDLESRLQGMAEAIERIESILANRSNTNPKEPTGLTGPSRVNTILDKLGGGIQSISRGNSGHVRGLVAKNN